MVIASIYIYPNKSDFDRFNSIIFMSEDNPFKRVRSELLMILPYKCFVVNCDNVFYISGSLIDAYSGAQAFISCESKRV